MALHSSSPALSSPPSGFISDPASPPRLNNKDRKIFVMGDEIVVDTEARFKLDLSQPPQPQDSDGSLPAPGPQRKKPARKSGSAVKKAATEDVPAPAADAPVKRKPRKPKDPNAPPVQRKRKQPPTDLDRVPDKRSFSTGPDPRQPTITDLTSLRIDLDQSTRAQQPVQPPPAPPKAPPRSSLPSSMHSLLNHDDPPSPSHHQQHQQHQQQQKSPPQARNSGQKYDPVRSSNYDPVRETMVARDPWGTGPLGSPRAPPPMQHNKASASPSITSLIDPVPVTTTAASTTTNNTNTNTNNAKTTNTTTTPGASGKATAGSAASSAAPPLRSPLVSASQIYNRYSDSASAPNSPPNNMKPPPPSSVPKTAPQTPTVEPAPQPQPSKSSKKESTVSETTKPAKRQSTAGKSKDASSTTAKQSTAKTATKAAATKAASKASATKAAESPERCGSAAESPDESSSLTPASAPSSKKITSVVLQERKQQKGASATSSPKISAPVKMPPVPDFPDQDSERSILDFGKANPADKKATPSIVLSIPLHGESNKYVNFMRMAEDQYGWDALHPREAAHRDRKARIAAAASALEKNVSGRETGDEETDKESDVDNSDAENKGGNGAASAGEAGADGASGPDGAPVKKQRKKRNWREDEYDKDDDFVDDSEMLWEEQAAASKDGFFVYSGPLIPEAEKSQAGSEATTKRGRGGGRGSRGGGRGAAARGNTTAGRGRGGGGPGSRGGQIRKPRATKAEKEQAEREKAEREKLAQGLLPKSSSSHGYDLNPAGGNLQFSGMVIDL